MKTAIINWIKALAFGCSVVLFVSCDDSNEPVGKGNIQFEITDGPSDDSNVKGVFVTVTDIKIDGKSIGDVQKTTLNLKSYNEGTTKVLAMVNQYDAKTYKSVSLVLDLNIDEYGASPGTYVQSADGTRHQLKTTEDGLTEIVIFKDFEIASNATTQVILDFDIRKSIAYHPDENVKYKFVGDKDLSSAIRVVVKDKSGMIKGSFSDNSAASSDKVIVYAYKKGTFSASTETQPQGENQMYFINAAGSTEVRSSLNGREFTIAFLEEGDYEVYFATYEQTPSGRNSFKGVLQAETSVDGSVGNTIKVRSGATVSIVTVVKGIL